MLSKLDALLAQLTDSSPEVRDVAYDRLYEYAKVSPELFRDAVFDFDIVEDGRMACCEALAAVGEPGVKLLLPLLDRDSTIGDLAAFSLRWNTHPGLIEPLMLRLLLSGTDHQRRNAAAWFRYTHVDVGLPTARMAVDALWDSDVRIRSDILHMLCDLAEQDELPSGIEWQRILDRSKILLSSANDIEMRLAVVLALTIEEAQDRQVR